MWICLQVAILISVESNCSAVLFANSVFLSSQTGWIISDKHGRAPGIRKLMPASISNATCKESLLKNLTRKKKSTKSRK